MPKNSENQLDIFLYDLVVVEVVLDALDDLVVFMAFAGDEDDIPGTGKGASRLDSCGAVFDDEGGAQLLFGEPTVCKAIVSYERYHSVASAEGDRADFKEG